MSGALLALDTSGSFCSIALRRSDGVTLERASSGEGDHFERLPDLVAETLREGQVSARDLTGIVVGLGPGSFTGLRIGLSYAKGLATATHVPLQGVSSFDALAAVALAERPELPGVVVVSDARREEVFVAAYQRQANGAGVRAVAGPAIVSVSALGEEPWGTAGWGWYSPQRDFELAGRVLAVSPSLARGLLLCAPAPTAFSLSEIASLEPSYLRAVAAKTIEERRQGA